MSLVRFSHSNRGEEAFQQMPRAPECFEYLARPAGGDQVFAMKYSDADKVWSRAEAVSPKGEDTAGSAIAGDGQGKVWAVWSSERAGNFDIYARANSNGQWGTEIRVTKDAGTDLNPVAATDAKGRVWIAWQGFRNNNLEVLAAMENARGDGFSGETVVSVSRASDYRTWLLLPLRTATLLSRGILTIAAITTFCFARFVPGPLGLRWMLRLRLRPHRCSKRAPVSPSMREIVSGLHMKTRPPAGARTSEPTTVRELLFMKSVAFGSNASTALRSTLRRQIC